MIGSEKGTGGDGAHTFNVSTAVALVVAGAGVKVAKHGNRAISSRSGGSDVLSELGVKIDAGLEQQRRALDEANLAFLFAPAHHGAMRHVTPIRQELGFRTIFNLLGPLSNPAGAQRQLLGVYDLRWVEEPVISDDLHGYAELRALNLVNISGGEHEYTLAGFRDALALKAFDIAQFDVNRVGGITQARQRLDIRVGAREA